MHALVCSSQLLFSSPKPSCMQHTRAFFSAVLSGHVTLYQQKPSAAGSRVAGYWLTEACFPAAAAAAAPFLCCCHTHPHTFPLLLPHTHTPSSTAPEAALAAAFGLTVGEAPEGGVPFGCCLLFVSRCLELCWAFVRTGTCAAMCSCSHHVCNQVTVLCACATRL